MSVYYDPMISKLVVHAENRPAALRMMVFALSRYQIGGIKNNIEFVSAICKHPAFVKGSVTTHFIDVCGHVKRCTISLLRLKFCIRLHELSESYAYACLLSLSAVMFLALTHLCMHMEK